MYKIFVRSIVYSTIFKQNIQLYVQAYFNHRSYTDYRGKKIKKMFRTWEFTNEAYEYQQELQKKQQLEQQTTPSSSSSLPTAQRSSARHYRLVSYNILAQDLLTEHLYLYYGIDTKFLRWEHRLHCLKNELNYINADILCIQEMQFNHLKEFVELLSQKRKMEYVYKKKTGHRTDGCAIIYDRDLFQLIAHEDLELYQPNTNNKLNRENVAIFAKFKLCQEPEKEIVIGTTHLLFNPKRSDVRVAQVDLVLKTLQNFAKKCDKNDVVDDNNDDKFKNPYYPVIFTGDMNSEPNSPPFRSLTSVVEQQQQCEENHEEKSKNSSKKTKLMPSFLLQSLNFGRNAASTHHDRWIVVDYILRSIRMNNSKQQQHHHFTEDSFKSDVKVLSIYKLPSVNNCERMGMIPNHFLGSDHYLQAIEFLVA